MPLSVRRVRRANLPWAWFAVLGVWAGVVAILYAATRGRDDAPPLCMLRRTTGVPCPTCGGTRAAFSLFDLRPLDALAHNPLLTLVMVLGVTYLAGRTLAARGIHIDWTRRARATAWIITAIALLANWAWVLHRHSI
ncbi:MAG: DUF2752 domain-containing protein [Phycisphaerales bacterium]